MLSENTKTVYKVCLHKLENLNIDYKNIKDINIFLYNIKNIQSQKGGLLSNNGIKIYLSAILYYYKENNTNIDQNILNNISNEIKNISIINSDIYDENKLNDKEKKIYLEWNEIVDVYNKLHDIRLKNYSSFRNCIILGLYVLFPPRRLMDYSKMIVKSNTDDLNDTDNYFIIKYKMFIFNSFKTKNTSEKIFYIPDNLNTLLNEYIDIHNLQNKYLLNTNENDLSKKIKKIMTKYTNKSASVNIFRHSYITYMQNNNLINSTKLKKELASKMGHSHHTQQEIYVKYHSDTDSDDKEI